MSKRKPSFNEWLLEFIDICTVKGYFANSARLNITNDSIIGISEKFQAARQPIIMWKLFYDLNMSAEETVDYICEVDKLAPKNYKYESVK